MLVPGLDRSNRWAGEPTGYDSQAVANGEWPREYLPVGSQPQESDRDRPRDPDLLGPGREIVPLSLTAGVKW